MEVSGDGESTPYSKPCFNCRKRKVKCDKKTRPCANCSRSKQLCTYESSDSGIPIASGSHDNNLSLAAGEGDIRERLARLESLMATLLVRDNATVADGRPEKSGNLLSDRSQIPSSSASPSHAVEGSSSPRGRFTASAPVGQILFQEGYSAYFDAEFHMGLVDEIDDLRRLFEPSVAANNLSPLISSSLMGLQFPSSVTDLSSMHPTTQERNLLLRLFFQSVNPFIHVIHESNMGRELDQYVRGVFSLPREFEALLFSIYTITINSLDQDVIERLFSVPKTALLARFQQATQIALSNASFYKTDKLLVVQALLHYLTFLFQQNAYKDAVALLGVAVRLVQTMGHHRSPTHFPYSPWVCELRNRVFNHVSCLDALALNSYGAESCLPATSDAPPPKNSNDRDWHASRFAKPSSVPHDVSDIKEMTFCLVNREISDLTRQLSALSTTEFQSKENLISQTEASLNEKYLKNVDRSNQAHTVIVAFIEVKLSSLRLSLLHQQLKVNETQDSRCFIAAIELLEAFEYHSTTFAEFNWSWIFQTIVPWLAITIVLTKLPFAARTEDRERARKQVEIVFNRYSNASAPISNTPMWQLLVLLRQRLQPQHGQDHNDSRQLKFSQNANIDSMDASGMLFNDDLMLDFGMVPQDTNLYDNELTLQDALDLPWMNTQGPY